MGNSSHLASVLVARQGFFSSCFQNRGQIPLQTWSVFFLLSLCSRSSIFVMIWLPRSSGVCGGGGEAWKDDSVAR